jgi:hypothetical protein
MIAVREFTSAAECIAHAQAVHRKFFTPIKVTAIPAEVIEVQPVAEAPVVRKRYVLKPRPAPPVKRDYLNIWEMHPTSFNSHVIAWRRYLLMQDMNADPEILDLSEFEPRKTVLDIVIDVLAAHPGITVADLKGRHRRRDVTYVRHIAMFEVYRQRKDMSHPAIGRWFGGRDHTTVLHAVRKISALQPKEGE